MTVFYVNAKDRLASVCFTNDTWTSTSYVYTGLSEFAVASGSRHLTITTVPDLTFFVALLMYESADGNVIFLNGTSRLPFDDENTFSDSSASSSYTPNFNAKYTPSKRFVQDPLWSWNDDTTVLQASRVNASLQFSAPFTSVAVGSTIQTFYAAKDKFGAFSDQGLYTEFPNNDPNYKSCSSLNLLAQRSIDY